MAGVYLPVWAICATILALIGAVTSKGLAMGRDTSRGMSRRAFAALAATIGVSALAGCASGERMKSSEYFEDVDDEAFGRSSAAVMPAEPAIVAEAPEEPKGLDFPLPDDMAWVNVMEERNITIGAPYIWEADDGQTRLSLGFDNKTDHNFASLHVTYRIVDADRFAMGDYEAQMIVRGEELLRSHDFYEFSVAIDWPQGADHVEILSCEGEVVDNRYINLLTRVDPFPVIGFGQYPYGRSGVPEAIEWYVLDERDDGTKLLLSKYVLDNHSYHSGANGTWETSDLRAWLAGEFMDAAFDDAQRAMLVESRNVNAPSPLAGEDGQDDYGTYDYVFVLSCEEVERYLGLVWFDETINVASNYSNGSYYDESMKYSPQVNDTARTFASDYAVSHGVRVFDERWGGSWWWLRNRYGGYATCVTSNGSVRGRGEEMFSDWIGVRPAVLVQGL